MDRKIHLSVLLRWIQRAAAGFRWIIRVCLDITGSRTPEGPGSLGGEGGVNESAGSKDTRCIPKVQTQGKGQPLGQIHSSVAPCPSGSRWLFYSRFSHSPWENLFGNDVLSPFLNLHLVLRHHQDMQPKTTPQRFSAIFGKEKEHSCLFILFLIKGFNCRGKRPMKTFLIMQTVHSPPGSLLPSSSLAKRRKAEWGLANQLSPF